VGSAPHGAAVIQLFGCVCVCASEWALERPGQLCDNGLPAATHSCALRRPKQMTNTQHSHFIVRHRAESARLRRDCSCCCCAAISAVIYYYCFCAARRCARCSTSLFRRRMGPQIEKERTIYCEFIKGKPRAHFVCVCYCICWTRTPLKVPP